VFRSTGFIVTRRHSARKPTGASAPRSRGIRSFALHNIDVIDPQAACGAISGPLPVPHGGTLVLSFRHSGANTMRATRSSLGTVGLAVFAVAAATGPALAQAHGACWQIRVACIEAGFIQGAAHEGVGLQIHCITPIMQGRPQPPTARRPLPKVNPQMVAACQATRVARFGRPWSPDEVILPPAPVVGPAPGAVVAPPRATVVAPPAAVAPPPAGGNPPTTPGARAVVADAGADVVIRPPTPVMPEQRSLFAALPPEEQPETGPAKALPVQFRRTTIDYASKESAGTIIIDTAHTYLYLVLGNGKAMRYGIGVGREGFTWSGTEKVTKMAEWPDWHPPEEMIARQPYLPRFMAGGEGNPLGARALYLGQTLYRIHGTNQPSTIGTFVSSGCIRLTNEDISDLYGRVQVGTRVVVLPASAPASMQAAASARPAAPRPRSKATVADKPAATAAPGPSSAASPVRAPPASSQPASKDTTGGLAATPAAAPPAANLEE
jgi:lipoprotein-anchoring transpeptidase ErfK/SrfK